MVWSQQVLMSSSVHDIFSRKRKKVAMCMPKAHEEKRRRIPKTVPNLRLACLLGIILLGAAATTAIQAASATAAPLRVRSHSIVSQIVPKEETEDENSLFDPAHRDMTSHYTSCARPEAVRGGSLLRKASRRPSAAAFLSPCFSASSPQSAGH